jgi:hypothetical protein
MGLPFFRRRRVNWYAAEHEFNEFCTGRDDSGSRLPSLWNGRRADPFAVRCGHSLSFSHAIPGKYFSLFGLCGRRAVTSEPIWQLDRRRGDQRGQ